MLMQGAPGGGRGGVERTVVTMFAISVLNPLHSQDCHQETCARAFRWCPPQAVKAAE